MSIQVIEDKLIQIYKVSKKYKCHFELYYNWFRLMLNYI